MSEKLPCPNGIEDDCGYPACAHASQCEVAENTPSEVMACSFSRPERPEKINERLFDLVRCMRSELLDAKLITEEEYMFLLHDCDLAKGGGSPSPRRLEAYDRIHAKTEQMEGALKRIMELAAGWDADGATCPKAPMSWETVARLSLDYARSTLSLLQDTESTES